MSITRLSRFIASAATLLFFPPAVKVEVHSSSSGAGSDENLSSSDLSERSGDHDHDYEDIYLGRDDQDDKRWARKGQNTFSLCSVSCFLYNARKYFWAARLTISSLRRDKNNNTGEGGGGGASRSRSRDSGSHSRSASVSSSNSGRADVVVKVTPQKEAKKTNEFLPKPQKYEKVRSGTWLAGN